MKAISDVVPIFTHNDRSATNLLKLKVGQQYIWESSSGKFWHLRADPKDILHREDGPAIEYRDGSKKWFLNGKLHREDGPAVEYVDGTKEWYLNGKSLNVIPQEVLENYMKVNNYTLAHLLTDPDPFVRESTMKYKWEEVI